MVVDNSETKVNSVQKAKRTHKILKPSQKREIVIYSTKHRGISNNDISQHFSELFGCNVPKRTISDILKNKEKWMNLTNTDDTLLINKEHYPELEKVLVIWINLAEKSNVIINDDILIRKARDFSNSFKVSENFKFSSGWLQKFKKRNGIKLVKLHGEAASVDFDAVEKARNDFKEILGKYDLSCIYNMDETGLFYELQPSKTLCQVMKKQGTKQSKKKSNCCTLH